MKKTIRQFSPQKTIKKTICKFSPQKTIKKQYVNFHSLLEKEKKENWNRGEDFSLGEWKGLLIRELKELVE
jgi:hypothetical protein